MPAPAPSPNGYVEVFVAANEEQTATLMAALRELLARLGLELRVVRAESPPEAALGAAPGAEGERARVSVDETPADHVVIAVSALRDGRVAPPIERTLTRDTSSAILTEQIAHVIHSTLESLLTTEPPEPAPPPPTPVVVEHEAPLPSPPSWWRAFHAAAMAYGTGRGVGSGAEAVLGAGGALGITAWRGFARPTIWLSGAYNAPFDETTPDVTVRTTVTSLRAGATLQLLASRFLGVDAGLAAGADVFHTVPGDPSSGTVLAGQADLVDPVVTARAVAGVRVVAGARVVVGVDVDCDVADHRYVIERSGTTTRSAVFQPWTVRPSAMVGLCVPLVGTIGCGE